MDAAKIGLYALAIITSLACTVFLVRAYVRKRMRLLLWSALCFGGLTINNILLFMDLVILPQTDLRAARLAAALIGMLFLLYGFIEESE